MRTCFVLILVNLSFLSGIKSQDIYVMSDKLVEACEGILIDSGEGDIQGNYDHNEDYIFSICIKEAARIELIFTSFCTEVDFDLLRIFDGRDTLSPLIGRSYSGTQSPGIIYSTGGCLTLHFKSDENITCSGWRAQWAVEVEDPIPTLIETSPQFPSCSTKVLTLDFDEKVPCTNIKPESFLLVGPAYVQIVQATPQNCQGDSTQRAEIVLDEGLFKSGDYYLSFLSPHTDACGEVWELYANDTLKVRDCPIEIDLSVDRDSICPGECNRLLVDVSGGDLRTYHYDWLEGFPDSPDPVTVCPNESKTYHLRVYDENGSPIARDSISIFVRENPVLSQDTIVCQTVAPFELMANPAGGYWSGNGIIDGASGIFDPDSAKEGVHTIRYEDKFGCSSRMRIQVNGIDAGRDEAACTGAPAFGLIEYEPTGGVWSGQHVSSNGLFSPEESGIFTLDYTVNGCIDSKKIVVGAIDLSAALPRDSLCESDPDFFLNFSPKGGVWKGTGIVDTLLGKFSPSLARGGRHKLIYQVQGCKDSIFITIKNIAIGGFLFVCTDAAPIGLGDVDPDGGLWSGRGIIDADSGVFDPGIAGFRDYNQVLRYTVNGCYAERTVLVRETRVPLDTAWFCMNDGRVPLDFDHTRRSPYNGKWSGKGVLVPDNPGIFSPATAGPGAHVLVYDANGCQDSLVAMVYGNPITTDTALCEFSDPIHLTTNREGGVWAGVGITDSLQGIFNPKIAGRGFHQIYYASPQGCFDSMEIEVYVPETPLILNLEDSYCFLDSTIQLNSTRPGGIFKGPGIIENTFNPMLAGPGEHIIEYEFGAGACLAKAKSITLVREELRVLAFGSADTVCAGGYAGIFARGAGGLGNNYTYTWLDNTGRGDSLVVRPESPTTYRVVLNDGCTMPDTAEVFIAVKDGFSISFAQGDSVCKREVGYVVAQMNPPGNYEITWQTVPLRAGDTLWAPAHFEYEVEIEDVNSGCVLEAQTSIPSFEFVYAQFSANPNGTCLSMADPTLTLLNQSQGALRGIWNFGDGTIQDFHPNENPTHTYADIGKYTVSLYIENEAGCWDTTQQEICVLPEKPRVYIPNSFTPNGDNTNDHFQISGVGIIKYELLIFDRWGKLVFKSEDINHSWDGMFAGQYVSSGIYTYFLNLIYKSDNPLIDYGPTPWWEQGVVHVLR